MALQTKRTRKESSLATKCTWVEYIKDELVRANKAMSCRQIFQELYVSFDITPNAVRVYIHKGVKVGHLVKVKYPGHINYYALPSWVEDGKLKEQYKPF